MGGSMEDCGVILPSVYTAFMKCVVDVTKVWTLLAKYQGSQLPEEQQRKSAFDERSEESSAQQYFQVQRSINTSSVTSCVLHTVVCSLLAATEYATGNNITESHNHY